MPANLCLLDPSKNERMLRCDHGLSIDRRYRAITNDHSVVHARHPYRCRSPPEARAEQPHRCQLSRRFHPPYDDPEYNEEAKQYALEHGALYQDAPANESLEQSEARLKRLDDQIRRSQP